MKKLIISITSLFVLIAVIILTQWVYQGRVPLGDLKKSLRPVRVGYLKYGFDWNIIIDKENILRNKGWDVVYTPAVGSPADLVQTYASGQFDIITSSVGMAAKMYEKDVPLRVFGTLLTATGGIVVDNDSTITTVEDLRGKNIGVVIGSSTFQDVMVFLDKGYGINLF